MTGKAQRDPSDRRRDFGFSLIEALATVFLTGLVTISAFSIYTSFTRSSNRVALMLEKEILSLAVVDRVASELESAFLVVKAPGVDPLENPWIFLAEARHGQVGSDRLKFMTRNHERQATRKPGAGTSTVSLVLRPNDDDSYDLLRWVSPRLPDGLDRDFPSDEESAMILAEGLDHFALLFLAEDGSWHTEWDSSTLESTSQLPLAVEIQARAARESDDSEFADVEMDLEANPPVMRRVLLPVRPLDLEATLEGAAVAAKKDKSKEGEEDGCMTLRDCVLQKSKRVAALLESRGVDAAKYVGTYGDLCIDDISQAEIVASLCRE